MTRIEVRVKPNSKHEGVEELGSQLMLVRVNSPAREGRANARVIEILAEHFGVSKSKVILKSGPKSKTKIFLITV
ncbi:DUF167 domain-containing protein [bacterium]|nr:DUF167 domain-containing protein [bacterium]